MMIELDSNPQERIEMRALKRLLMAIVLLAPVSMAAQVPDSVANRPDTTKAAAPAAAPTKPLDISGFVTTSYTYGVHHTGQALVGRFYDRFHDQFELNAAKLVAEKTVATDKFDAGARVDLLFG